MITGTGTNLGFEDLDLKDNAFGQALYAFELSHGNKAEIKVGSKIKGKIVTINSKYVLVDYGGKASIRIDLDNKEKLILDKLTKDDMIEVIISEIKDRSSFEILGSAYQLKMNDMTDFMSKAYSTKMVLTGIPQDLNHAGYNVLVNINEQEVILFMPHLLTDVNKLPNPESILNTEIEFILESFKKDGQDIYIASRKGYLQTLAKKEMSNLKKGGEYQGFVTGCTDFAVFVQFNGCLTGMIHKSNLTEQAVQMLPNIPAGTTIGFYVKDIMKDKLFLTQVIRESLWDSISINDELTGTVSSVKDFGLMVDLDYETKGLIHKSMLSKDLSTYTKGDKLRVIVTQVNKNNRQITLALK